MNKIEQMVKEMCPGGVRCVKLETLLDYKQPTPYIVKSTEYCDTYPIPVLTAGQTFVLGFTNETFGIFKASKNNPTIIFDDFTTSFHWVDFDFKVKSSAMKMLTPKTNNSFRYIYYAMSCIGFVPTEHSRHWISKYSQFEIPLPPLPIQEAIVEILDKFESLQQGLQDELQARKKQYEYYRNKLLTQFPDNVQVKEFTLGEIAIYSKERIGCTLLNPNNYVSVENLLQNKQGKVASSCVPTTGNWIKFSPKDILIGNIRPYLQKIWLADCNGGTNGDVLCIRIADKYRNDIIPEFLYYVLSSNDFFDYDTSHSGGGKMPRGDKKAVLKYPIIIPSKQEQQGIVSILDHFETLVNDQEKGIPAEIATVKKQYEYYRNKLLTF